MRVRERDRGKLCHGKAPLYTGHEQKTHTHARPSDRYCRTHTLSLNYTDAGTCLCVCVCVRKIHAPAENRDCVPNASTDHDRLFAARCVFRGWKARQTDEDSGKSLLVVGSFVEPTSDAL